MKSTWRGWVGLGGWACVLAVSPAAEAGERMSEAEMERVFAGVTLDAVYATGEVFTETYREDGSIRYHDSNYADSGRWYVEDRRFCTFYEKGLGACFMVERDGANCFSFYETDPDNPSAFQENWTSRGWDSAAPATCPTPPEAET